MISFWVSAITCFLLAFTVPSYGKKDPSHGEGPATQTGSFEYELPRLSPSQLRRLSEEAGDLLLLGEQAPGNATVVGAKLNSAFFDNSPDTVPPIRQPGQIVMKFQGRSDQLDGIVAGSIPLSRFLEGPSSEERAGSGGKKAILPAPSKKDEGEVTVTLSTEPKQLTGSETGQDKKPELAPVPPRELKRRPGSFGTVEEDPYQQKRVVDEQRGSVETKSPAPVEQVVVRMPSETADSFLNASPEERRDFLEAVRKAAVLAYRAQAADELVQKQMNEREKEDYLAKRIDENVHGRKASVSTGSDSSVPGSLASADVPQVLTATSTAQRVPTRGEIPRPVTPWGASNRYAKEMARDASANRTLSGVPSANLAAAVVPSLAAVEKSYYSSRNYPWFGSVSSAFQKGLDSTASNRTRWAGKALFKSSTSGSNDNDSVDANDNFDDEEPETAASGIRRAILLQYLASVVQQQWVASAETLPRGLASVSPAVTTHIARELFRTGQSLSDKLLLLVSPMGSAKKDRLIKDIALNVGVSDAWATAIYRFTYALALIATAAFVCLVVSRIRRAVQ